MFLNRHATWDPPINIPNMGQEWTMAPATPGMINGGPYCERLEGEWVEKEGCGIGYC